MAPSKKTLQAAFGEEAGGKLRDLLTGKTDPEGYETVENWVRQCYNRPSDNELVMEAANEVIGGFGVESIRGRYVDRYHMEIQAAYVNTGDTYSTTLLLDHETDRYQVTSWGDWFEANESKRELN